MKTQGRYDHEMEKEECLRDRKEGMGLRRWLSGYLNNMGLCISQRKRRESEMSMNEDREEKKSSSRLDIIYLDRNMYIRSGIFSWLDA